MFKRPPPRATIFSLVDPRPENRLKLFPIDSPRRQIRVSRLLTPRDSSSVKRSARGCIASGNHPRRLATAALSATFEKLDWMADEQGEGVNGKKYERPLVHPVADSGHAFI